MAAQVLSRCCYVWLSVCVCVNNYEILGISSHTIPFLTRHLGAAMRELKALQKEPHNGVEEKRAMLYNLHVAVL